MDKETIAKKLLDDLRFVQEKITQQDIEGYYIVLISKKEGEEADNFSMMHRSVDYLKLMSYIELALISMKVQLYEKIVLPHVSETNNEE